MDLGRRRRFICHNLLTNLTIFTREKPHGLHQRVFIIGDGNDNNK